MDSSLVKKKKLFLIDGSAVIYRSYFAFIKNPLINSKGENTSATFGFLNLLLTILQSEKPDFLAIVFDTGHPTFRHEMFPDYKATREKMPDELRTQIPRVHQLANYLKIPVLEMPGYEADDIIGTLSKQADIDNMSVFLVSGDKDFMQLITENVCMYSIGKSVRDIEIGSFAAVKEKFGVKPDRVIDVLGLMGDTSDNVPGVRGIGPKTAMALIQQYDTVENLYDHIDELKESKNKERLIAEKEIAFLSKKLVTIHTNVPIDYKWNSMIIEKPETNSLKEFLFELEFQAMYNRVEKYLASFNTGVNIEQKVNTKDYVLVNSDELFIQLMAILNNSECIAFDTETTSVNSLNCELVGFSFSEKKDSAYYLPTNDTFFILNKDKIFKELKVYFENSNKKKIGHNIKFDALVLSQYNIMVKGIFFDTMIAHFLLEPQSRNHGLKDLANHLFDANMKNIDELIGKGAKQITMDMVGVADVFHYACDDANYTYQLFELFKEQINKAELDYVFYDIEMKLLETLLEIEKNGVHLDLEFLKNMSNELEIKIRHTEAEIFLEAGESFNMNSPKQLGPILFEKLKIHEQLGKKAPKKTTTGQYSTAEDELAKYENHTIVKKILDYRELNKLKSTYVDAIPLLINPKTNAIHTSFNQTIASTGRLSSTDPNLQNIPIKTELGREIRKSFIPSKPENYILSADYSQIELRIMAHMAADKQMIAAFKAGLDIHKATAALVFGVELDDVTTDMRRKAKEINFGIIYGMSQWGLASRLNIKAEEARAFIDNYFIQYPGVLNFMMNTVADARKSGEVKTICGRKRQISEINSDNRMVREGAERVAINSPIQGSAADLIKLAMINIQKTIYDKNLKSKMILQVHDELVFDVPEDELSLMQEMVKDKMENAMSLSLPLKVELGFGKNWLQAH